MIFADCEPVTGLHEAGYHSFATPAEPRTNLAASPITVPETRFVLQNGVSWPTRSSARALTALSSDEDISDSASFVARAEEHLDDVTVARDRRLELLALQFVKKSSREDDARYHILTERLRRLIPRVSSDHWSALEAATSILEDVSRNLDELKKQFVVR